MNKRKLMRSSRDKSIHGVCGGIAEFCGISSFVIRLIFIFMPGSLIIYIILANTLDMGASYHQMIMVRYNEEKDVWIKLVEMGSPEVVDSDIDGNKELVVTSRGSLPETVEIYHWNGSQFERVHVAIWENYARIHNEKGQFLIE